MSFSKKVKEDALVACKRYCCLCRSHCGQKMQMHHIKQKSDGGDDTFDNAIPLCLNCHADVKAYNPHHPIGTPYGEKELRRRRDAFYKKIELLPINQPTLTDLGSIAVDIFRDFINPQITESSASANPDSALLEMFKDDFTELINYIIKTSFDAEPILPLLRDEIEVKIEKWAEHKNIFQDALLEGLKRNVGENLRDLLNYLTLEYFQAQFDGYIIFKNDEKDSFENIERLRNETYRIRENLTQLLFQINSYRN